MKKYISAVLCLLILLPLCACGSSDEAQSAQMITEEAMFDRAYFAEAPVPAPSLSAANSGLSMAAGTGAFSAKSETVPPEERPDKIIYSADATVETTDFDATVRRIDEMVESYGGWIESSSVNGANYGDIARGRVSTRSAYYTLRVPSDSFSAVMEKLSALGNIPYSSVYTDNISAQYYDAQARLDSLQTQEQSLNRLMEKAESVEDVIAIEEKLTEVRYSIESIQSTLRNWDRKLSYSSINLSVNEVEKYTPPTVVHPGFLERLGMAIGDGFRSIGRFFTNLLLFLAEALPTLLLIAAVITAVVWLIKKKRNKTK